MMEKISKRNLIVGVVGLVLFVVGVFGWQGIVNSSPDVLELTESAQWGLLVGMFLFFEALGSGCLVVGALKRHLGLTVVGVAGIIGACTMVLMDLFHPAAAWRLFLAPNVGSPMFLDVLFSSLCIVFGVLLAVGLARGMKGLASAMRPATIVVAVLFPLGTAWLCTTLPGQLGWSTIELVSFFLGAGVCAGAGMCFFGMREGRYVLMGFLAGLLLVNVAEVGFLVYGEAEGLDSLTMREVVFGKLAPLFWVSVVAFMAVPLALTLVKKVDVRVAAVLGAAGVACTKYLFAVKGNLFPYLSLENVDVQLLGLASGYPAMSYVPGVNEWLAAIGGVGLVVALVAFGLPLFAGMKDGAGKSVATAVAGEAA